MTKSKAGKTSSKKPSAKVGGTKSGKTSRKTPSGSRGKAKSSFSRPASGGGVPWLPIVAGVVVVAVIAVLLFVLLGRDRETSDAPGGLGYDAYDATPVATEPAAPTSEDANDPVAAPVDAPGEVVPGRNGEMPEDPAARNGMYAAPPEMEIDPGKIYLATFETGHGDIVVELFADKAPNTVNNFVFLAREGFYNGTTFHRVLENFMAQGGDPTGTGSGGPGYMFADEFHVDLRHDSAGVLSMANSGPGTNGSQFFLTFAPTPWLDGAHTVFGKVVEGLDVLQAIPLRDPATAQEPGDRLISVTIEERETSLLPTPTPEVLVEPGSVPMPEDPISRESMYAGRPVMGIDPEKEYTATFETQAGDIVVELFAEQAPEAVNSFVFLAREGFYDDTPFYYVLEEQIALGGDPTLTGMGGPGYLLPNEFHPELQHAPGTLSMLNLGLGYSSHFLFAIAERPDLDGQQVIIGRVTEGLDILQQLPARDPQLAGAFEDAIETVRIDEK